MCVWAEEDVLLMRMSFLLRAPCGDYTKSRLSIIGGWVLKYAKKRNSTRQFSKLSSNLIIHTWKIHITVDIFVSQLWRIYQGENDLVPNGCLMRVWVEEDVSFWWQCPFYCGHFVEIILGKVWFLFWLFDLVRNCCGGVNFFLCFVIVSGDSGCSQLLFVG